MLPLIEEIYADKENYRIRVNNNYDNNICYIYCSSNALYIKGDEESFRDYVIKKDRYEWENISPWNLKPRMEIYIRDVWLSWYVRGINTTINTYEKLIEFIQEKTKGYKVRCVGASSGAFIATILSVNVDAELCYNFAGQFSLISHFNHVNENPFLNTWMNVRGDEYIECYKYLDYSKAQIIYLLPVGSKQDTIQYKFVEKSKAVRTIKINQESHGVALYPFALANFLSYDAVKCEKYCRERCHNKLL